MDRYAKYEGHTEGPWIVSPYFKGQKAIDIYATGADIASVPYDDCHHGVATANGNLIADAPKLLADVKRLRAAMEECITDDPGAACYNTGSKTRRLEYISKVARAALAEGGAE